MATNNITGIAFISSTFNNTIVTISDSRGNVIAWKSAGGCGFKGSRKGTPFAAEQAAKTAASLAKDKGVANIHIVVKGIGSGADYAVRGLSSLFGSVLSIRNETRTGHNGCRPRKKRRV